MVCEWRGEAFLCKYPYMQLRLQQWCWRRAILSLMYASTSDDSFPRVAGGVILSQMYPMLLSFCVAPSQLDEFCWTHLTHYDLSL